MLVEIVISIFIFIFSSLERFDVAHVGPFPLLRINMTEKDIVRPSGDVFTILFGLILVY